MAGDIIARTHAVAPLSAVQNVYSILERGVGEVGVYCITLGIICE